jgi:hypothetical protein
MEENDPPGGGSGGPPPPPAPPSDKTYSQKEKDKDEAALRRRYDREIKQLKVENEKLSAEITDIKEMLKSSPPPPPTPPVPGAPPADPHAAGQAELDQRRRDRELAEMNERISIAEKAAADEKQKRLELEKQQLLDDAIVSAGVTEKKMKMARRYFLPQVEWDDLDAKWMFRLSSGSLVEIADGVEAELPDSLKPSLLQQGGAGTQAGMPLQRQRKTKELEEAEAKLKTLKEAAAKNGRNHGALSQFTRQKRVVERLRNELVSTK